MTDRAIRFEPGLITYKCIDGRRLDFELSSEREALYLERIRRAVEDPDVSVDEVFELIFSVENPVMNTDIFPGKACVSPSVADNPVYLVMRDLEYRKYGETMGAN